MTPPFAYPQIMGTMMASFAEGLALAKQAGLSQEDLLEASGMGAIAAPMFAMKVLVGMLCPACLLHCWTADVLLQHELHRP
jgi:3-hydroxyisobutyrate dehydrogenase-like beta-hydroxyacid dehydrogenase